MELFCDVVYCCCDFFGLFGDCFGYFLVFCIYVVYEFGGVQQIQVVLFGG